MFAPDDRLLYVLSARRVLDWATFKKVIDALHAPPGDSASTSSARWSYSQTARSLDALGHCDLRFDDWSGRVSIGPAILSRLPLRGLPEAVLLGSRSPATLTQLKEACATHPGHVFISCDDEFAALPLLPRRITIQAESLDDLTAIARSLKIDFAVDPPSWALAHFAGSLNEYLRRLQPSPLSEPDFQHEDFDLRTLRFRKAMNSSFTATRLSRYSDPARYVQRYLLWSVGDRCVPIDRDWGCYAALRMAGIHILVYDERRALMAVPLGTALPRLFARALTLCSGRAPYVVPLQTLTGVGRERLGHTVYRDVPEQVAELVAEKLNQRLIRQQILETPYIGAPSSHR